MTHAFPVQASPSMAIAARQPPSKGDHGPSAGGFAVALAAAGAAGGAVPPHDDPSSRVPSLARDGADIFNARGFFADDAAPDRMATDAPLAGSSIPVAQAGPTGYPAALEQLVGCTPTAAPQARPFPAAPIAMQAPRTPSPSASARRALRTPVFATARAPIAGLRSRAANAPATASSVRRAHPSAPPASAVPVAVAISQIDAGLRIVARLDGLDEHERAALQDDIAALVARHGSKAADITVVGRGRSPAFGQGQS